MQVLLKVFPRYRHDGSTATAIFFWERGRIRGAGNPINFQC